MLKLEKRVLEFELEGAFYKLPFPTVDQISKFQKTSKELTETDPVEAIVSFLSGLGLDEKVCRNLEIDHANTLIEFLTSAKKN